MKLRHLIPVTVILLSTASCEKELDFKYHDIAPLTVIEGIMSPDEVRVGLTLTTPMDELMDLSRLTDATVSVEDLNDGNVEILSVDSEGYYSTSTGGAVGHNYRLKVERSGSKYQAVATMYGPVDILSVEFNWIKMPYDHVAVLQCKFTDDVDTEGDCYWVKIYRNGEIYRWIQTDDRSKVDGLCSVTFMTTRKDTGEEDDDDVLYDGDVVTCSVSRISRLMYEYLEALGNNSNGPAMYEGDQCLGYFMATSTVEKSIEFKPDEIPFYN
ncbi:MAG: DUF4249 family protein [Barnesiella sp.]|nr:DUF4249 family protein [Barnesiella sp.]